MHLALRSAMPIPRCFGIFRPAAPPGYLNFGGRREFPHVTIATFFLPTILAASSRRLTDSNPSERLSCSLHLPSSGVLVWCLSVFRECRQSISEKSHIPVQ